jgi:hypothetical protein
MAIPSVKLFSNEPGGGLVTSLNGINSLANNNILRQINSIKKDYMPRTTEAEINSKNAYARLVGLQPLGKLLASDPAYANLSDAQKEEINNRFYKAGTGQGGNAMNQIPTHSGVGQPSSNSFSWWVQNAAKNLFGQKPPQGNNAINQRPNAYDNSSNQGVSAEGPGPINNGSPFVGREGYKPTAPQENDGIDHEYDAFINNWLKTPEGQREIAKGEQANIPSPEDYRRAKQGSPSMEMDLIGGQQPVRQPTFAENTANYKGTIEEGKESGKIRAQDIDKLNTSVFNAETSQNTLNELSDVVASPVFEGIRQTPLAGHHELAYYAKEGTPEQQQVVGKYYTLTGNIIKDSSRDFAGQFRKGEQQLLTGMKANPDDTVDTAKGKVQTLSVLNRMLMERSRLTSKYMSQHHANKLEASEWADKHVDGEKIREEAHDRLNPTVSIRDPRTGKTMTLSISEARRRGVPNV